MDMKLEIAKSLSAACGVAAEEIAAAIEVPANTDMGDFAYPCFKLAKVLRKAPPLIAQEIGEKLEKPDFIADVKIVGAYINFFMDKHFYTKKVLETVLTEKENYGKSDMGAGKTIVIDYSSPNIAKPFHVGHLRSTVIGNALYQIHSQLGYKCVGVNHLGDWGTQFGKLICASNSNNVLTDFIRTGVYDKRRPLLKTTSPSMDILVSSNLERLLYLLSGDTALVSGLMNSLNREGVYTVPGALLEQIQKKFWAAYCDDAKAQEIMGRVYRDWGYLCDPHTASGWAAAEEYVSQTGDNRPMVVLSTASPYKFPAAVLAAVGGDTSGSEFDQMARLSAMTDVPIPKNLAGLQGKPERHTGVINKEDMLDYVLHL